jgi:hypothetical protein
MKDLRLKQALANLKKFVGATSVPFKFRSKEWVRDSETGKMGQIYRRDVKWNSATQESVYFYLIHFISDDFSSEQWAKRKQQLSEQFGEPDTLELFRLLKEDLQNHTEQTPIWVPENRLTLVREAVEGFEPGNPQWDNGYSQSDDIKLRWNWPQNWHGKDVPQKTEIRQQKWDEGDLVTSIQRPGQVGVIDDVPNLDTIKNLLRSKGWTDSSSEPWYRVRWYSSFDQMQKAKQYGGYDKGISYTPEVALKRIGEGQSPLERNPTEFVGRETFQKMMASLASLRKLLSSE